MKTNYLIIGTARGGTTALYEYLIQHPDIVPAPRKEMHFFDRDSRYGDEAIAEYKKTFFNDRKNGRIIGEATPYYLYHPLVPERVAKDFPNTKIIVLLRNPVDRAYSHYHFNVSQRTSLSLTFEQTVECEKIIRQSSSTSDDYQTIPYRLFSLVRRGEYVKQLRNWMKYFPKEQIHIIKSEDFLMNKYDVLEKVFKFLEVEDFDVHDISYRAIGKLEYEPMSHDIKRHLTQYFVPYNKRLYNLIGQDFQWNDDRPKYLNIGCGNLRKNSTRNIKWINIDQFKTCNPDIVCDITKGLPFTDNEIHFIDAFAMLGQIVDNTDFLFVMNEFWRVLKSNSILRIYVPHKDKDHAYHDPFNRRYFNEESFKSFDYQSQQYIQHLSYYGFRPWVVESVEFNDAGFIDVNMRPKK